MRANKNFVVLGVLTLVLMEGLDCAFLWKGGGANLSIPFLNMKTIENVIRLRTVLNFFEK